MLIFSDDMLWASLQGRATYRTRISWHRAAYFLSLYSRYLRLPDSLLLIRHSSA